MGREWRGVLVGVLGVCLVAAGQSAAGVESAGSSAGATAGVPAGVPTSVSAAPGRARPALETDPVPPGTAARVAAYPTLVRAAAYPLSQTFALHSLPGSQHTIFLDFDGTEVSGTAWNEPDIGLPSRTYGAWNTDGVTGFSWAERTAIQSVWQRVAEDYAPFDVDVTTEDPGAEALDRTGADDPTYGTRVLVTSSRAAMKAACPVVCSGSAWFDVVDRPVDHEFYQPAFVFPRMVGNDVKDVAEVVSHEVGHNFGLLHDGTADDEYFSGHRSWAPIMGAGFGRPITQWSKGAYAGANNQQDDLAIIAANGAPLRADEAGDTTAGAGPLPTGTAYITDDLDRDVYALGLCGGPLGILAKPARVSPDLDIRLTLLRADGTVVARANKPSAMVSRDVARGMDSILLATLTPGRYWLQVTGTGHGGPLHGYGGYASVGSYTVQQNGCVPETP